MAISSYSTGLVIVFLPKLSVLRLVLSCVSMASLVLLTYPSTYNTQLIPQRQRFCALLSFPLFSSLLSSPRPSLFLFCLVFVFARVACGAVRCGAVLCGVQEGVKKGMRFHHHQLEKVKKHQRSHSTNQARVPRDQGKRG